MSPRHGQDPVSGGWVATVAVILIVTIALFGTIAFLMGWV